MRNELVLRAVTLAAILVCVSAANAEDAPLEISGRYPHLATFNHNGECGTGAVVPWADRLWVITYGPHMPFGGDDKLYEIDSDLKRTIRPESVGGTPANRMIHRESNQLNIGNYFIDAQRNVRVISPKKMPGRLTATARSLTDPENKLDIYTMEGKTYEVDVHTLAVKTLFDRMVPGWHGKGAYSGQGRLVLANNGEIHVGNEPSHYAAGADARKNSEDAGVLAEFDGKDWRVLERKQFTEVTGPGGIEGPPAADAPLWSIGFDKRSVMLKLLDHGQWQMFRMPKADYSYDGKHGWFTEWPRIREIAPGKMLMNMHGGWYEFPKTFAAGQTFGLRPIGSYLKITGDFCGWKDGIVFGCDDISVFGSPNTLSVGNQSQSNLWFSRWDDLGKYGRIAGFGGPWLNDEVKAGEASVPYLFGGYSQRCVHLSQDSDQAVNFTFETDAQGKGEWTTYQTIAVPPHGYVWHVFPADLNAEWIRVKSDRDCAGASAYFHYGPGGGAFAERDMFASLADAATPGAWSTGRVRARGDDKGTLLFEAKSIPAGGAAGASKWFEVGLDMKFQNIETPPASETKNDTKGDVAIQIDDASVIVTQGKINYRLPKSDPACDLPGAVAPQIREIVTERSLLNAGGSIYMVPRMGSGGVARMKPVCTHNKPIADYCSWRGTMVLTGNRANAAKDGHYFGTADGEFGLWFGDIDDLWKMGKPRGKGGPWLKTAVKANAPSDPYLMTGYDKKSLELSHDAAGTVHFTIEVDYVGSEGGGTWQTFQTLDAPAGQPVKYEFPAGYSAHWVRFRCDTECHASAILTYE